jgi:ADP-ribose pyrophosphatase YjhB (NUDIX family)
MHKLKYLMKQKSLLKEIVNRVVGKLNENTNLWFSGVNPTVDNVILKQVWNEYSQDYDYEVLLITRGPKGVEPGKLALPGGFIETNLDPQLERDLNDALDMYDELGANALMDEYGIAVDKSKPIENQLLNHFKGKMKGKNWQEGAETPKQAALRELEEETGLDIKTLSGRVKFIKEYEGGGRDPRDNEFGWAKSYAFGIILPEGFDDTVRGMDDASNADWYNIDSINFNSLAFDHGKILKDGINALL